MSVVLVDQAAKWLKLLICSLKDGTRVLPSDFPIRYTCCVLGVNEA